MLIRDCPSKVHRLNKEIFDPLATEAYRRASSEIPQGIQAIQTSGRYPNPSEVVLIQSEIRDLEDQAGHAQIRMQELTSHLLALEEKADRYRALLSPIRKIPPEILSVVLASAAGDITFGRAEPNDDNPSNATNLSLVCSYWRRVCLDTPALWSNVSIGTDIHPDTDQHDVILENLGLVLGRSKDVPLSYKLDLYEDHDLPHPSNSLSVMRTGTKITHALFGNRTRSGRVRHLAVDLAHGGWPVATELAGAYGRELENLYGIEIRLDCFSAVEAPIAVNPFLVLLPRNQITTLILSGSRVQTVPVALEALPNLITADITLEWNHFMNVLEEQAPDCPIIMTFLKTLSITVQERHNYKCHFEVASWTLASIITPSLSQFSLCIKSGLENGSAALGLKAASNLAQFFARSDPANLHTVDITGLFPAAGLGREYGSIFDPLPKYVKDLLQRGK